jgi:hypothetical protein
MNPSFNAFSSSGISSAALSAALSAKLDKAGGTMTGALTINAGTLATAGLTHQQTWNSAGTTCRGMEVKVTDTASASDSTLLRVLGGAGGTTERFSIRANGDAYFTTSSGAPLLIGNAVGISLGSSSNNALLCSGLWQVTAATGILRSSNRSYVLGFGSDVELCGDASDTLALKRGSNAQTLRVYGNTTGSHYLNLTHNGTNAVLTVNGGGKLHIGNLPTSNPGPGILWNNAGTPAIGT